MYVYWGGGISGGENIVQLEYNNYPILQSMVRSEAMKRNGACARVYVTKDIRTREQTLIHT